MSIPVGSDIGEEIHVNHDQFIRVESGKGIVKMGKEKDNYTFSANVSDGYIIIIPTNTYHNLINTGDIPLKLYSLYAPPVHKAGTIHKTKKEASLEE